MIYQVYIHFTNLDFPGCPFFGEVVRGRYNLTRTILLTIFNKSFYENLCDKFSPIFPQPSQTLTKNPFLFQKKTTNPFC